MSAGGDTAHDALGGVDAINTRLEELCREPVLRGPEFIRVPRGRRLGHPLSPARIEVFEAVNQVRLPEEYRLFLGQVGNGGVGPSYGLCELSVWRTVELPARLIDVPLPEGGCKGLAIVERGCSDVTVLLVSGSAAGQVVDLTPERFREGLQVRPQSNFLDWYWEWLNSAVGSFEAAAPRPESVLVEKLLTSEVNDDRARAVYELGAVEILSDATVELIERCALSDSSSAVRYQAVELLGLLERSSPEVFLEALKDPKRSISRRALVHILRLFGDTPAWDRALAVVCSAPDRVGAELALELDARRARGVDLMR